MNKKDISITILSVLVLILAISVGYMAVDKEKESESEIVSEINGIKKYDDDSLYFEYPESLALNVADKEIKLSHSIPYVHRSHCDFKGDAAPLDKLTDFSISIQLRDMSIREIADSSEYPSWSYMSENPFKIGNLKGYKIMSGVEGCGQYIYYLDMGDGKTVEVKRWIITEFNESPEEYLKLDGIVNPSEGERIFGDILLSLKVK